MPWMMWEKVYQSVRCCEFSELATTPCHSFTYPHRQIGTRPIANSMEAAATTIDTAAVAYARVRGAIVGRRYGIRSGSRSSGTGAGRMRGDQSFFGFTTSATQMSPRSFDHVKYR